MTVDAVVVRWRGGEEVDRCLRSLLAHGRPHLERVTLVDSGSLDGGAERLAAAHPAVEVLALTENRSFAWAADRGAEAGSAPLLLLLNPDAELGPGALDPLLGFLETRPQAAGAVPLLFGADGRAQHRWQLRRLPGLARLACGLPGVPAFAAAPRSPAPVAQPAAAAWLVRRPVWQALGGLDPGFVPAWWEDVDFCARLDASVSRAGFPAGEGFWVVPSARVAHAGGSSVGRLGDAAFLLAFHRNLLRYARRHRPRQAALIACGVRLSLLLRAVLRPGRRRAYLEALRGMSGAATGEGATDGGAGA